MNAARPPLHKVVVAYRGAEPGPVRPPGLARRTVIHRLPDSEGGEPSAYVAVALLWLAGELPPAAALVGDGDADAYLVEERVRWDDQRSRHDPGPIPGVKRLSFIHRREDLTRAGFADCWAEHVELARRHHPTIWRYVQNIVLEPLTPGAPDFDGVAELAFRELADLRERMYDSEEGARIIGADVRRFIDLRSGERLLGPEHLDISDENTFH